MCEQIQPRVTSVMQAQWLVPFTIEEIYKALHTLPRHNCSGVDGLSPGFFIKYWELIKIELCEAFQLAFDLGYLLDTWKAGHIFLIPKGEQALEDICKWRPITILNTVYKIFMKTINLRLQPWLSQLIHSSQTGFIKEQSILDNIFTFWETTALALKSNQQMAILLLDLEKHMIGWTGASWRA